MYCSNTTFSLVESLPLLTNKLKVPDEVSWEEISTLKLSLVPSANTPLESIELELFCLVPWAIVANVKAVPLIALVPPAKEAELVSSSFNNSEKEPEKIVLVH